MNPADTTLFFDFDNTLFRTREFWIEYLLPFYQKIGVTRDMWDRAWNTRAETVDYFIPALFVKLLHREPALGCTSEEIAAIFEERMHTFAVREFLYPYADQLLRHAKERGYEMFLLSYGDRSFKETWFPYCGMSEYFDATHIIITNGSKAGLLRELSVRQNCSIINDVLQETQEMIQTLQNRGFNTDAFLFDPAGRLNSADIMEPIILCHSLDEINLE